VVALFLGICIIILFNAFASVIHKSKKRATIAIIQITRLLVKFDFQKACDLNNGSGCSNLGFMYKEGKGVKQDILFNALAFFIHKSKIRATTAKIQI
jgi:hypothetical protein